MKQLKIKDLKKAIKDLPDNLPVFMYMDWSMLKDCPKHLQQQWEDDLGSIAHTDKGVYLMNKNFR